MRKEQMMTVTQSLIGASSTPVKIWSVINWRDVETHVRRLRLRIAKAIKIRRYGRVKSLQWLLTHSFFVKLLAVRRVTQNTGKNTPGVDRLRVVQKIGGGRTPGLPPVRRSSSSLRARSKAKLLAFSAPNQ